MKKILSLFIIIFITVTSNAQNNWCGFDQKMQEQFNQNPALENQMYERYDRIASGQITAQERSNPIIVPVVVHVIHDNGIGNVSYAQILSAINMLNEDFNRLNGDSINTRNTTNAPFQPIASNVGVQFKLAKIDPQGNCTNGVERRNSAIASYDGNDQKSKFYSGGGLNAWDRNKYFNIWVVNSLENSGGGGLLLGYAQFPVWGSADTYGVIIRQDYFGSVGTANGDRTITHEVGHCFGLAHTFQSGCGSNASNCSNQGDGCCDTPPVDEAHWSCLTTQNNCSQVPNGDYYGFDAKDQFENFMSYSPCQNMFSQDQKAVVLGNFSSLTHMINLASLSNINYTGVNQTASLCKADFNVDKFIMCEGTTINFTDYSFSNITNRTWTFTGGAPNTSNDSAVAVTYNQAGVYPVTIEVTDGNNTITETKTSFITVLPSVGTSLPFSEGFETINFPDNYNYFIINEDDAYTWETTNLASYTGTKSIKMKNFGMPANTKDAFISGPIDLSILDPSENFMLTFKYAYNKRLISNDEWLQVSVSKDCGETWTIRKNIHGSSLSNNITPSAYTPTSKNEWKSVTIQNINDSYYVSDFRFKFEFISDAGNNLYIDDINLFAESWLNTSQIELNNSLSVFPNPSNSIVNIQFMSSSSQNIKIDIYNTLGQKISSIFSGVIENGKFNTTYNINNLPKGIYIIKVKTEKTSKTIKFTKN